MIKFGFIRQVRKMSRRLQSGLSLVELMITMGLGTVVTAGVIQMFVANQENANLLNGQSRVQEGARFVFSFIGRDIRLAGYRGCYSSNRDIATSISNPDVVMPYEYDLRLGLRGYNADPLTPGSWQPALTDLPNDNDVNSVYPNAGGAGNGIDLGSIIDNTDVLTLRNKGTIDVRLQSPGKPVESSANTNFNVVVGPDGLPFDQDELALIHDCEKATIFRITNDLPDNPAAGTVVNVQHNPAGDNWSNTQPRLASSNFFGPDAAVSLLESHIYFIAPGSGINNDGNVPLSLWRKDTLRAPEELVEGVEDLQIFFGVDSDFDLVPNNYTDAAHLITDWTQVITIRVTATINSVDSVGASSQPTHGCVIQDCYTGEAIDGLMRRTFTQTFQLRNRG